MKEEHTIPASRRTTHHEEEEEKFRFRAALIGRRGGVVVFGATTIVDRFPEVLFQRGFSPSSRGEYGAAIDPAAVAVTAIDRGTDIEKDEDEVAGMVATL